MYMSYYRIFLCKKTNTWKEIHGNHSIIKFGPTRDRNQDPYATTAPDR